MPPEETTETQEQEATTQQQTASQQQQGGNGDLDIEGQIIGPVVEQVNSRISQAQEEILARTMERVDQRMNEMRQPTQQAQETADTLFGGTPSNPNRSPGARQGESSLTSRKYSYFRAMRAMIAPDDFMEDAKVEIAMSRQLQDYYETRQFKRSSVGGRSVLVPFGSSMLPEDIGDVQIKGNDGIPSDQLEELLADPHTMQRMVSLAQSGKFASRFSQKMNGRVNQALSIFDDTGMGIFADSQISEIIELVRAVEVFPRIGVREITLPPNGYLPLGRQTGAATGSWIGEGATISTSEPTTGQMQLRAKKAGGLVLVPNELFRFSTMDTEGFIRADLARVLALLVDLAGLEGTGTTAEPLGIINRSNIETLTASTTAANGDTLEPNDPSGMMAAVEENNHDIDGRGWAWIMRGKMWQNLLNRRAGAAGDDQFGPYLFAVNREAIQNGMPGQLNGWPVVKSGQVSNTRVKNSGTDLTYILGGIPDDIIIGRVGVLEFTLGTEGTVNSTNLFETDQSAIRAIEHADFGMRHENSWALIDDIDMDLPSGVISS